MKSQINAMLLMSTQNIKRTATEKSIIDQGDNIWICCSILTKKREEKSDIKCLWWKYTSPSMKYSCKKKIKQQLNKELISIASLCDIQGTNKQATGCT